MHKKEATMRFIDRHEEMERLNGLVTKRQGGLAIVYGRRRIGKTRLLLEWIQKYDGLYMVADQSSAEVQRMYLAQAVSRKLPGFAEVDYPDWSALLTRLAREARQAGWRGPVVIDELPYLVTASPELPSILQRWIDHEAREAGLTVALAGSSQRMMQGLVLASDAPLYGRAREIMHLEPLAPKCITEAFRTRNIRQQVECYAAWGGVPRYWEMAIEETGSTPARIDRLVLNPLGPLHQEPDRLLIEEHPSAIEIRPVLDAIGMGVHRVSEIAGRIGHRATSLARPLDRIVGMGLVRREVPFGELERKSRRSLYRIADPFFCLWFKVVAPYRAFLATASASERMRLLKKHWPMHVSSVWEDMCRLGVIRLAKSKRFKELGKWGPALRWWHGNAPEWDLVAESLMGRQVLLGEAKWKEKPFTKAALVLAAKELQDKPAPMVPKKLAKHRQVRFLFVPQTAGYTPIKIGDIYIVTGKDLWGSKQ